jgi:hypothetical protein
MAKGGKTQHLRHKRSEAGQLCRHFETFDKDGTFLEVMYYHSHEA